MAPMSKPALRPVDLGHLDRYTGGSRSLNEEILRLFNVQCREMVARLEGLAGSSDAKSWHEATHTLKGAARGVGAFALADAAAAAEETGPSDREAALECLARLRNRAEAVESFIAGFLGS